MLNIYQKSREIKKNRAREREKARQPEKQYNNKFSNIDYKVKLITVIIIIIIMNKTRV